MALAGEILTDLQSTINTYGESVRIRYFTTSYIAGSYDDQVTLAKSGNDTWVSGLVQPLSKNEAYLVQQGKLLTNDLKVYLDSAANVSGTWKMGIGSGNPPAGEYVMAADNMVDSPQINGSIMYQKLFLRRLTTGSIFGE